MNAKELVTMLDRMKIPEDKEKTAAAVWLLLERLGITQHAEAFLDLLNGKLNKELTNLILTDDRCKRAFDIIWQAYNKTLKDLGLVK